MSVRCVALCGNPNVGKSTVFNALTGLKQHTGNWAGKTVETAHGSVQTDHSQWKLVDLPGAYSLFNGSPEENVASDFLTFGSADAVIVVCDAVCLERNLNLALQIMYASPKTVLCINMMDEAKKRKITIDLKRMSEMLKVPVVGISARGKIGLSELKKATDQLILLERLPARPDSFSIPSEVSEAMEKLSELIASECPSLRKAGSTRFASLRALYGSETFLTQLSTKAGNPLLIKRAVHEARKKLLQDGLNREKLISLLTAASYERARELCAEAIHQPEETQDPTLKMDRLLCKKRIAIPLAFILLCTILYLTILGANVPSAWLSLQLNSLAPYLTDFLRAVSAPVWLTDLLVQGVYRVTSWIIAVMLPPMAIFFPLFTLLEDLGLLPRAAFHLDRCFHACRACGKQALCMCMGMGCNAVGVTGCRIIQSPRERLIAILTNSLMPCNGRFPTLIALISMFFLAGSSLANALAGSAALAGCLCLCVCITLGCSWFLSHTLLSGLPSSFALELPPFRRPKIGEVLIRSVFDRTLFVLGRAICVAAPAGALLWILGNVEIHGNSLLTAISDFLHPAGRAMGMDGAILLAFILGLPANEIVLPLILMIYQEQGILMELQGFESVRNILAENGWTMLTAICTMIFTLFHWPCSTTLITIYKETRSLRWTALGFLLPAATGALLCIVICAIFNVYGLLFL